MNFLFCSPLQHQPFEDLISIPSNGSALVPRLQVKKHILEAVHGLPPWGKRQFELPCISLSGLLTDLRGQAAEDALPMPGSTGLLWCKQVWPGLGRCSLPSPQGMRKMPLHAPSLAAAFALRYCQGTWPLHSCCKCWWDSGAERWQNRRVTCPSKTTAS